MEPGLRSVEWGARYSHEDGDLVASFFVPALQRSVLYRRVTGYFAAEALGLAARGLDGLLQNGGRMQLVVGCTLDAAEVDQIERGLALRDLMTTKWADRIVLTTEDQAVRKQLGWLAWLIAAGRLDVKVAIPKDEHGRIRPGLGLYHAKAGLLDDAEGNQIAFTGSLNETVAGWIHNGESFDVSCSWGGDRDVQRIQHTARDFERLWHNRSTVAEVVDVPDAVRQKLLQFLPTDDQTIRPPLPPAPEPAVDEPVAEPESERESRDAAEVRIRQAWTLLRWAAARKDGEFVAVQTSTVHPWPHQLRVHRRLLDNWPFRLLIADEVGLGKTIEAGLAIRHAWISGLAKRILILVPGSLLEQWQVELYEKFNLLVPIYADGRLRLLEHHGAQAPLERDLASSEWTKQPLVLASSHLVRRQERQHELLDGPEWDLIVLDEAHHARQRGVAGKSKGPNRLLALMRAMQARTKALLLLTATPMQVSAQELYDLLELLGLPSEWTPAAFHRYFEELAKNPGPDQLKELRRLFRATESAFGPIAEPVLRRVEARRDVGRAECDAALRALREMEATIPLKRLTDRQRAAAIGILEAGTPIQARMSRHTRSLLRAYHKRGLLHAPIAERDVHDVTVQMTQAERTVYEAVEDYISSTWAKSTPDLRNAVGFVLTSYRMRMSSSFHALRMTLEKRLDGLQRDGALELDEDAASSDIGRDEAVSGDEATEMARKAAVVEERAQIQEIIGRLGRLSTDSKTKVLIAQLQRAFADGFTSAIVFSQYEDTMKSLTRTLPEHFPDVPFGCFSGSGGKRRTQSGDWARCSREDIKRLLREEKIRLLLCTDAASEGLNFQTCGVLANYDLPWNPMKVEQRIGRIDRIGQKYPRIRIVNLAYDDTIEHDVYFALSERIHLFQGLVGKLQPILARLPGEFERAALTSQQDRERSRHELKRDVGALVDRAEHDGFDIDAVSEADFVMPEFPEPPFRVEQVTRMLEQGRWLPPGVECRLLDAGTFALRVPGCDEEVRVTAEPTLFDAHTENHQLLQASGELFDLVAAAAGAGDDQAVAGDLPTFGEILARGAGGPSR
ncbi:MAG: SNF2-related protein [Planctomycetota bacterium]